MRNHNGLRLLPQNPLNKKQKRELKVIVIQHLLNTGTVEHITEDDFEDICDFAAGLAVALSSTERQDRIHLFMVRRGWCGNGLPTVS